MPLFVLKFEKNPKITKKALGHQNSCEKLLLKISISDPGNPDKKISRRDSCILELSWTNRLEFRHTFFTVSADVQCLEPTALFL